MSTSSGRKSPIQAEKDIWGAEYGVILDADVHTKDFSRLVPEILEEHYSRHGDRELERDGGKVYVKKREDGRVTDQFAFWRDGKSTRFIAFQGRDREWENRIETIVERTEDIYRKAWQIYDNLDSEDFMEFLEEAGKVEDIVGKMAGSVENITGNSTLERDRVYAQTYLEVLGELYGKQEAVQELTAQGERS